MAFNWLGMFGIEDYQHLRQFLLQELRNVDSRALQIDVEMARIGNVNVIWKTDGNGNATEQRIGIFIRNANSSIGKLMRAYIAQGGNPFDVSMYLDPEEGKQYVDDANGNLVLHYKAPYGGVVTVKTREMPTSGFDAGGELIWHKNERLRIGKSNAQDRAEPVAEQIASARHWANSAIRQKRSDLEFRIMKLLDLREQLLNERRFVLGQSVAEMVTSYKLTGEFVETYTLRHHIKTLDAILFETDTETKLPKLGEINVQNIQKGHYDFITPPRQKGEDDWLGMKTPQNLKLKGQDRVDVVDGLAAPNDGSEALDPE